MKTFKQYAEIPTTNLNESALRNGLTIGLNLKLRQLNNLNHQSKINNADQINPALKKIDSKLCNLSEMVANLALLVTELEIISKGKQE